MIRASKIELWPTKSNHWPTMTRTDLDPSIYSLVARVDEPFMIASRPSRFINLDHRFQTMSSDSQIALFIDGANLYATAKALGFDIDYRRLLKEFQSPREYCCARSTTPQLSKIRNTRPSAR